ncbi:DNA/RNA helicase domain-containing protein [Streptodolium elevatio]
MRAVLLPSTTPAADCDFIEIEVAVPQGGVVDLTPERLRNLRSALGVQDPACLVVETDGLNRALVTVYRRPPLANLPAARGQDLVMNKDGYICVGAFHDGMPAPFRLYEPGSGAQRSAIFGTTGGGKSRAVQLVLAAEKRSRITSWLADLKMGQSCPEAKGQVDWRVTTSEGAMDMLLAAYEVAKDRMARYAELGRSHFIIDRPDPLLSVTLDEANRLLEKGSPYREGATYFIRELGRTGRSVGVGVRIAAQAGHLEDLGGSDVLRAMLKEGEVVLLRWSSGIMQQLVSDGLLPMGMRLAPIPKYSGAPMLASRFDHGTELRKGASTAGTAYLLSSDRPGSVMRWSRVGSLTPVDGLDPEITALYGPGDPRSLEAASHAAAGPAYLNRHNDQAVNLTSSAGGVGGTATLVRPPVTAGAPGQEPAAFPAQFPAPFPTGPAQHTARTISSRILDALTLGAKTKEELVAALAEDGGQPVSPGGVANALTGLKQTGKIRPTEADSRAYERTEPAPTPR